MSDNIEVTLSDMELVEKCDYETKLAITAWVIKNIVEHAEAGGGSFRSLIYGKLGFKSDAYVPLYEAGGMTISNEFDLQLKDQLAEIVKENNYEKMKPSLGLCDESGCYNETSCGWPTPDRGYRNTCSKHYLNDASKA